ncbi:MAG TPA: hypothetical protein PKN36_04820 [bacterium]|nr:hypothetical protein [bacterium]
MIEKIWKYIKILYKGIIGIAIELIYPLITFLAAAALSFAIYITLLIKK